MGTIKHSKDFQLGQAANIVFPLFSAEGEKLWVPGWDYENIMGTTELHEDYIFLTKNHDHAAADAIWLVKRYEPDNYLVEFYKVEPEEKLVLSQLYAHHYLKTSLILMSLMSTLL